MKQKILLFWLIGFLLGSFFKLLAFNLHFQSVDDEEFTRLILLSDKPFQFVVEERQNAVEIKIQGSVGEFEVAELSAQSSFIEKVNYTREKNFIVVKVVLKDKFKIKRHFILHRPFRLIVDIVRKGASRKAIVFLSRKESADPKVLFERYQFLLKEKRDTSRIDAVQAVLDFSPPLPSRTEAEEKVSLEEELFLKNDIGLRLIGDYAYNTSLGITDVDEGPYKWRIRAGMDWDLLRDGLFKRKKQRRLKAEEREVREEQRILNKRKENYYFLHNYIIYIFSQKKIKLLEQRRRVIKELLEIARKNYFNNRTLLEEVVKLERDLARTENLLEDYLKYRKEFATYAKLENPHVRADDLPLVDVDIDALLREINNPPGWKRLKRLRNEELKLKYDFWKDVRLRLWLYYYYYNRGGEERDKFFSLGVQLSLPFPFSLKRRRELVKVQQNLFNAKFSRLVHADVLETMNSYDELKYKLDDYIKFYNKKRILQIRLQRAKIERLFGLRRISYAQVLQIVKELLEVEFELYHIKQQLYLRIIKIFRNYGRKDVTPFLQKVKLEELSFKEVYKGKRFLYIWSPSFNAVDNDYLVEFASARRIKGLLISLGESTDREKLKKFLTSARERNMKIYALFGNNEWLKEGKEKEIREAMREAEDFSFDGVHLDVEPYTLKEWKKNSNALVKRYCWILKTVRSLLPQTKLQVSVPVRLINRFSVCLTGADEIFLMLYGKGLKAEKAKEILRALPEAMRKRSVLVLRISDFQDELKMEDFIDEIYRTGLVRAFAFHSLEDFLKRGGKR